MYPPVSLLRDSKDKVYIVAQQWPMVMKVAYLRSKTLEIHNGRAHKCSSLTVKREEPPKHPAERKSNPGLPARIRLFAILGKVCKP